MSSVAVPVLVVLVMTVAYVGGMIAAARSDKRRIRSEVLRNGGKIEAITWYSGGHKLESWRDANAFGPRCYKVRRVDADGETRTNAVFVGIFSGIKWGDSVR